MATLATSSGARTLLNPTYTGGVPASRKATRSAGSGAHRAGSTRRSARRRGPANPATGRGSDPPPATAGPCGRDRGRCSTGGRPDCGAMRVERVTVQRIHPLRVDVPQHPVVGLARRERLGRAAAAALGAATGWCRAGSRRTRSGCPAVSAIDRTPAGIRPVATTASHPSAAAATVSNCIATRLAAVLRRVRRCQWLLAVQHARAATCPCGISGTSTLAASSAKSGGAHTRTSAPRSRSRSANPSTVRRPRVNPMTTTTHAFMAPVPISGESADSGSCRKTPYALYVEVGRNVRLPPRSG